MSTQIPVADPEVENDPTRVTAKVDIAERPAASIGSAAAFPTALLLLAGFAYSIYTFIIGAVMTEAGEGGGIARIVAGIILILLVLILMTSLAVISPGQTSVRQFFGKYIGTVRRTGLVL